MGAKDERMLMQKFMDYGFGAHRYPQPAIAMKPQYQKGDFTHVRRQQPVDFFVNGYLGITKEDESKLKMFFRIGVEQKTTNGWSYVRSMIDEKSHVKFIEFCRKNCLMPVYIVIFTMNDRIKYSYHIGNERPYSLKIEDADWLFEEMLAKLLKEYIEVYDSFVDNFDVIEIDYSGDDDEGTEV